MATVPTAGRAAGRLPDDPAAFVAAAEHATNTYDVAAATAVYASDAVMENVSDGLHARHDGRDGIRAGWELYLGVARDTGLRIDKTVVAVGEDTIVNEWQGRLRDGRAVAGVESWRFDANADVVEHKLFGSLNVKPATDLGGRLRLLASVPRAAIAYVRAERRAQA